MWNSFRVARCARNIRNFSANKILRDAKPGEVTPGSPAGAKGGANSVLGGYTHIPSSFDKWVLIWTNKYPSADKIPSRVKDDILQSAMSKFRIRVANILMVLMLGYAAYTVITSKKAKQEEIKKIDTARDDYRRQITEEYRQKLAAETKK